MIDPHDDLGTAESPIKVTVMMNSYREKQKLFERAVKSVINAGAYQLIVSTVKGDPCIEWMQPFMGKLITKIVINDTPGIFQQINAMTPFILGNYVCYSSSNDYMLHHKLKHEAGMLGKTGKKVCYSAFLVKSEVSARQYTAKFPGYSYEENLQNSIVSDCAMVETKTFLKYMPFRVEYKNNAYRDLWLRIYEGEGDVFVYNPDPTWVYHVTEDSQHIRRKRNPELHRKNLQDRKDMLRDHVEEIIKILGEGHPVIDKILK